MTQYILIISTTPSSSPFKLIKWNSLTREQDRKCQVQRKEQSYVIWSYLSWCSWYHSNVLQFPQTQPHSLPSKKILTPYLTVFLFVVPPLPKHVTWKPRSCFCFICFLYFSYQVTGSWTNRAERGLQGQALNRCRIVLSLHWVTSNIKKGSLLTRQLKPCSEQLKLLENPNKIFFSEIYTHWLEFFPLWLCRISLNSPAL